MKNTIEPRYLVKIDYPFSKYNVGDLIEPNEEELKVIEKFKYYFEDKSITYKVLDYVDGNISSVRRLKDQSIFNIGDEVIYTVSHLDYYVRFKIVGFKEELYKDIIMGCFNKVDENAMAEACGIDRLSIYDSSIDYGKIVDLV